MKLFRRLRYLLHSTRSEAELREEIEFHRLERQRQLVRDGVPESDAVAASRRALGSRTLAREEARAVWIWPRLETIWQDIVYAARGLRREPGFTLVAVLALGAAIGLNTSLFTTLNAFLWRPWPVQDPDRVVTLVDQNGRATFSLAEREHFARYSKTLSGLVATRCLDGLSEGCLLKLDDADVRVDFVTPNYFRVLGISMARGAGFSDDIARTDTVAIVSDRAWRVRFAADPNVVGRRIVLDDVPFTIVGVTIHGFDGTSLDQKELWIPIGAMPMLRPDYVFDDVKRGAALSARLADGVTPPQAAAELNTLSEQFRRDHGLDRHQVALISTTFFPNPAKRRNADQVFATMFSAVVLVLGLACANVANLLLARGAARRRETGARLALGASRARIVRQLLTESLVLATAALVVGLTIAYILPLVLLAQIAAQPLALPLDPDIRVLVFAATLTVFACVIFGLAPALHGSGGDVSTALKEKSSMAASRTPLRGILLALQVAVSLVLLVSESIARRLWGTSSGLGQRVIVGPSSKGDGLQLDFEVVGIVKDVSTYYGNVTNSFPTIYVPIAGRTIPRLLVRHLDPGVTQAVEAFVQRIEPRTRIKVTSVAESLDKRLAQSRIGAWVAAVLGLLSACLAGLGVFSVFAYTVAQRASEIGIRLALGARPAQIVRTLLGSNARPLLGGLLFGIAGAVTAAHIIRSLLYDLSPFDPIAYVTVGAVLTIVAIAATILPARQALRIDPAAALRAE